ncbi:MAG: YbjN domain-containing protein [Gemmatimonadota bacterium]|nr:YbjN domain-containing protein [Gemmatimonadota bacterium]MDH5805299.1 YbjN domain-containing protein [Gemmatimonadota bacterium]
MAGREELENFIDRLGEEVSSEETQSGVWVISATEDGVPVFISEDPPVVVFRVNIMGLPPAGEKRNNLMQRLLELNAEGLVHGSYGIEGNQVVLSDALQLESLDFHEFQASFESITLALASHMPELASFQE